MSSEWRSGPRAGTLLLAWKHEICGFVIGEHTFEEFGEGPPVGGGQINIELVANALGDDVGISEHLSAAPA